MLLLINVNRETFQAKLWANWQKENPLGLVKVKLHNLGLEISQTVDERTMLSW